MNLLDLVIIALYFALAYFGHVAVSVFTLMVLFIVLCAVRYARGERISGVAKSPPPAA